MDDKQIKELAIDYTNKDFNKVIEAINPNYDNIESAKQTFYKIALISQKEKGVVDLEQQKELRKECDTKIDKIVYGSYPKIYGHEDALIAAKINPAKIVMNGLLRTQEVMVIAASSKVGKTFLQIQLALAVSNGLPWLEEKRFERDNFTKPDKPISVLFLNFEHSLLKFRERLNDFKDSMTKHFRKDVNVDNVYYGSLKGYQWGKFDGRKYTIDPLKEFANYVNKQIELLKKKDVCIEIVIIDPIYYLMSMAALDEINARDMTRAFITLNSIAIKNDTAVIFAHHFNKEGSKDLKPDSLFRTFISGSGVFSRAPDAIISILNVNRQESVKDPEADTMLMEFTLRDFPERGKHWLKQHHSGLHPKFSLLDGEYDDDAVGSKSKGSTSTTNNNTKSYNKEIAQFGYRSKF